MKYISIDIETTGLNPDTCDILEIGAYIEDTTTRLPREQLPCWSCYLWRDNYQGEPYALAMNGHIFQKILKLKNMEAPQLLLTDDLVWDAFNTWMYRSEYFGTGNSLKPRIVVAGKNVAGFDLQFLSKLPGDMPNFCHRTIDPGMLYFNPFTDEVPPDLTECKRRAGLPEFVSHEALDDAWDIIQLVRAKKFPVPVKPPRLIIRDKKKAIKIGNDGRCKCDCATPCVLGKIGSAMRCTKSELITAGFSVSE